MVSFFSFLFFFWFEYILIDFNNKIYKILIVLLYGVIIYHWQHHHWAAYL